MDDITAEHFIYGKCEIVSDMLVTLFNIINAEVRIFKS